jgi:hypothetical protein
MRRRLFPAGFGAEVMQLVRDTWTVFTRHHSVSYEEPITALFRRALIDAYVATGRNWFVTLEDPVTDPTFGTELGRNDLNFFPPVHRGQTVFFTVECKRLNITRPPSVKALAVAQRAKKTPPSPKFCPLAREYVTQGIKRFVSELYSKGLPCGGMVGYVMDNDLDDAFRRIREEIRKSRKSLLISTQPSDSTPSAALPDWKHSVDTRHHRSDGEFLLHHALFAAV